MNDSEDLPELSDPLAQLFDWFCERAVSIGNPTAAISMEDAKAARPRPEDEAEEVEPGIIALMNHGYLQRSGWRQYVITQTGFESYARARITGYEETQEAVRDAVAATDHTDTDVIVASTGESRYLVNHILRVLQRHRDIGAFVAESNSIYVTRVSEAFKRQRANRRSDSAAGPAAGQIGGSPTRITSTLN